MTNLAQDMTGLKLACVDDNASVRTSMLRLCRALGLSMTAYASGREFIATLDAGAREPDCLLLDAHMPEMTGLDVQRELAARRAAFPVIVVTADDGREVRNQYTAVGVSEYITKPFGSQQLLAAIERAMQPRTPL